MVQSRVFGLPSRMRLFISLPKPSQRQQHPLDAAAIAAALSEIKDFDTILGAFSFNATGDPVYDPVVLIVKDGKLEVFE